MESNSERNFPNSEEQVTNSHISAHPSTDKKPKRRRSRFRRFLNSWLGSILLIIFLAAIIRWLLIDYHIVSSNAMSSRLLPGDFLLISKVHYGARTPSTPLHMPLTRKHIWGTKLPSYLTWPQFPIWRLPWGNIRRNDIMLFNKPTDREYPVEIRDTQISRCIAIAGDTLQISKSKIFVNNLELATLYPRKLKYIVETSQTINPLLFKNYQISDYRKIQSANPIRYEVLLTSDNLKRLYKLKRVGIIQKITRQTFSNTQADKKVFPQNTSFKWNQDHFGPLIVPAEGMTIPMSKRNAILYKDLIKNYEFFQNEEAVQYRDDKLYINGQAVETYTFQQNYYFALGDHYYKSKDSRQWGFIPENHVIGKAVFIWLSLDRDKTWQNGFIRWERWGRIQ